MNFPLLLAQELDPLSAGKALGEAQSVQQVLGIVVGVLIIALLAVVGFYLREKGAWTAKEVQQAKDHSFEIAAADTKLSSAKAGWEVEKREFVQRERDIIRDSAAKTESLMREMLDLSLLIEKTLATLASKKDD